MLPAVLAIGYSAEKEDSSRVSVLYPRHSEKVSRYGCCEVPYAFIKYVLPTQVFPTGRVL